MTGDEWKAGSPYEDPKDRTVRDLERATHPAAASLLAIATETRRAVAALRRLAVVCAVAEMTRRGVPEAEARAAAEECAMIAAAEGRGVARALKELIRTRAA